MASREEQMEALKKLAKELGIPLPKKTPAKKMRGGTTKKMKGGGMIVTGKRS